MCEHEYDIRSLFMYHPNVSALESLDFGIMSKLPLLSFRIPFLNSRDWRELA
jgi:hypothetical protein